MTPETAAAIALIRAKAAVALFPEPERQGRQDPELLERLATVYRIQRTVRARKGKG